jgi:hypothetical protein
MTRTGGRVNDAGKVEKGRMPKGHCDPWGEPSTFKDGPMRIFRKKGK